MYNNFIHKIDEYDNKENKFESNGSLKNLTSSSIQLPSFIKHWFVINFLYLGCLKFASVFDISMKWAMENNVSPLLETFAPYLSLWYMHLSFYPSCYRLFLDCDKFTVKFAGDQEK